MPGTDIVDELEAAWRAARPGLDPAYLRVFGRIPRIDAAMRRRVEGWLAPFGLSWDMFDLLATLYRAPDQAMRPGDLSRWCLLSSGAMTKRIDRLVAAGLAGRRPDQSDRRAHLVHLTDKGEALAARAVPAHFAAAHRLLDVLTAEEAALLASLSRKLLAGLEA